MTGGHFNFAAHALSGYLFALVAAFMWASYSLMCKRVPFQTGPIGLFCFVSGALALGCHALLEPSFTLSSTQILVLVVLGFGPMGAAFFLWDLALKTGDPRAIGSLAYLTPMLSTLLLVLSGRAAFTGVSALAMLLILVGALIGTLRRT